MAMDILNSRMLRYRCPLCGELLPPGTLIRLRGRFDCPCCGQALQIPFVYEVCVKATALALAFIVAHSLGTDSIFLFFFGVVIWPLLLSPVFRIAVTLVPPVLVPWSPVFTTLNLSAKDRECGPQV
jgi:hypothetical protein